MTPSIHRSRLLAVAFSVLAIGANVRPLQASTEYHVSTRGSDANEGTLRRPLRTIQRAVDIVRPGDTIIVHAGTYEGIVTIRRSGTEDQPIILRTAGHGTVTLTSDLPPVSCSAQNPTRQRTVQVLNGADYWRIRDLTIVGGILVSGTNTSSLDAYVEDRTLPGRRQYDAEAAKTTLETLASDGADHVEILRNRISGRGISAQAAREGQALDNEIFGIACGTGGGILFAQFSDGWLVRGNHVHDVAASITPSMSDGIRSSQGSMYGFIERNVVEDVSGPGGGITSDSNSGWNVIRSNTVRRAALGYAEQSGGWGNEWLENVAESTRRAGFSLFARGAGKTQPDARTPAYLVLRCNRSVSAPLALEIGAVQRSAFLTNAFPTVELSANLREYWAEAGNTWDGRSTPPGAAPAQPPCRSRRQYVSVTGSDGDPGTGDRPFVTVQRGVDLALAGDTVLVRGGTYTGILRIRSSGAPGRPIVVERAGDGAVTLRYDHVPQPCTATSPTRSRTVQIALGADHWTVAGFNIVGGVLVSGTNTDELEPYLRDRTLPGRGSYDPAAARGTLETLGSEAAEGVQLVGNTITRRGIYAVAARYGRVLRNEISRIDCGTGPGVGLSRFSDGWIVRGNHVHHIAGSERHWMSEGIRHVAGSSYGLVENNLVEDLESPGRGITTDVNANWNVIRDNEVRRAFQGLSEQGENLGNKWIGNVAYSNRGYGFNIFGAGAGKREPGPTTPTFLEVRCNRVYDNPPGRDLYIGTVAASTFSTNAFPTVYLSPQLRTYWTEAGNTWDGSPEPPPVNPPQRTCP